MTSKPARRGGWAAFWCGLASADAALLAGAFYFGWLPRTTSGEAMLLLVFVAFPLGAGGSALGVRQRGGLAAIGAALALLTLMVVVLVVALVWLSWTRCASSCV